MCQWAAKRRSLIHARRPSAKSPADPPQPRRESERRELPLGSGDRRKRASNIETMRCDDDDDAAHVTREVAIADTTAPTRIVSCGSAGSAGTCRMPRFGHVFVVLRFSGPTLHLHVCPATRLFYVFRDILAAKWRTVGFTRARGIDIVCGRKGKRKGKRGWVELFFPEGDAVIVQDSRSGCRCVYYSSSVQIGVAWDGQARRAGQITLGRRQVFTKR